MRNKRIAQSARQRCGKRESSQKRTTAMLQEDKRERREKRTVGICPGALESSDEKVNAFTTAQALLPAWKACDLAALSLVKRLWTAPAPHYQDNRWERAIWSLLPFLVVRPSPHTCNRPLPQPIASSHLPSFVEPRSLATILSPTSPILLP